MIFWHLPFDVDFVTILKNDAMMMMNKMRVKPFDASIINRFATSVDCATQLIDECQVKRRER